jgi:hypothetical protein
MDSVSTAILPTPVLFKLENNNIGVGLTGFPTKSQLEYLEYDQTSYYSHVSYQHKFAKLSIDIQHTGRVFAFQSADLVLYHGPRQLSS